MPLTPERAAELATLLDDTDRRGARAVTIFRNDLADMLEHIVDLTAALEEIEPDDDDEDNDVVMAYVEIGLVAKPDYPDHLVRVSSGYANGDHLPAMTALGMMEIAKEVILHGGADLTTEDTED